MKANVVSQIMDWTGVTADSPARLCGFLGLLLVSLLVVAHTVPVLTSGADLHTAAVVVDSGTQG